MLAIRAFGRAEVHRDAVLHHFVLFQYLIEDAQRPPAINHEIFGYDFKPIHNGLARQNVMVVRRTQTYPDSVIRVAVKPMGRHFPLRWLTRKEPMLRKSVEGRSLQVPALNTRPLIRDAIADAASVSRASSSRRLRSRPCPCKSSCLCSHCRSIYIRPCPCRSSDPCKHAFPSPSCPLGPDRTGVRNACRREGWTPGWLWWYRRANQQALRQRLGPSLTLSFSRITSCEFGLQPHLLLLRSERWFWIAANGFSGLGWSQAPAVPRGFARSITPGAWPDNLSFVTFWNVRIRSLGAGFGCKIPRANIRMNPACRVALCWTVEKQIR